jgi:RNA-directed DNA polymerase
MAKQLTVSPEIEEEIALRLKYSASDCVWTYRMLHALDNGVKGNKWFTLKDKICRQSTMLEAYNKVFRNNGSCGIDKETIQIFDRNWEENLESLTGKLKGGHFQPLPVKRVYIEKPGSKDKRPLGIPTIRQRIVENAFKLALEPIFEKEFLNCSYGFRPKRGAKDALREVDNHLKAGYRFVIDADIKGYFDTIDHNLLMGFIKERIADKWVLNYLKRFLKNDIMDRHKRWTPVEGSPQGSVLSPLLSNIYLHRLDERMTKSGFTIIRYADDFIVMCKTSSEAERGLEIINEIMKDLKLTLHPDKTHVVEVKDDDGFEFLGYRFCENRTSPRKKSVSSLKDKIRSKTHRSQGKSLKETIKSLNLTLRGWYGYFKHIKRSYIFKDIDSFIRRRLRSILARFNKKYGSHRMLDNFKYPNQYFHTRGLFSLHITHGKDVILARGNL